VRTKMLWYLTNVVARGDTDVDREKYVDGDNGVIGECGNRVVYMYTYGPPPWYCSRINLLLAMDLICADFALYTRQLESCIEWQSPKWRGLCWRGGLHSPIEIFAMAFKKCFFFPSFVSASIKSNPNNDQAGGCFFNEWTESKNSTARKESKIVGMHNVKFEIDTSAYPQKSTLIQEHQTPYHHEEENLLSCYNIYEWKGIRVTAGKIPVISLKVIDSRTGINPETGKVLNCCEHVLPPEWMETRVSQVQRSRNMTPETFMENFRCLYESYNRNHVRTPGRFPAMTWLNANLVDSGELLPSEPVGVKLTKTQVDQL